jgi:hypothetical protein
LKHESSKNLKFNAVLAGKQADWASIKTEAYSKEATNITRRDNKESTEKGTEFSFRPPYQYVSAEFYSFAAFGQPAQPPPLSAEAQDAALSP